MSERIASATADAVCAHSNIECVCVCLVEFRQLMSRNAVRWPRTHVHDCSVSILIVPLVHWQISTERTNVCTLDRIQKQLEMTTPPSSTTTTSTTYQTRVQKLVHLICASNSMTSRVYYTTYAGL